MVSRTKSVLWAHIRGIGSSDLLLGESAGARLDLNRP
jgi:hypothetical protein